MCKSAPLLLSPLHQYVSVFLPLGTVTDVHSHGGVFCVFQEAENLVATVIPKHLADAAPEVAVYLKESVGNSTRIDYGTGT